jgi:hypothetical protein
MIFNLDRSNCIVSFIGKDIEHYPDTYIAAMNLFDVTEAIKNIYPELKPKFFDLTESGYTLVLKQDDLSIFSGEDFLLPFPEREELYKIEIIQAVAQEGRTAILGLGFLGLFAGGIGILGISATTFGLLGASLLFSSIFSPAKTETNKEPDKRSVNFSGSINVVGGSQPLPLAFGANLYVGSIVVSADIMPQSRPV